MTARRSWRSFDLVLLVTLLGLTAYGVTMIYSATIDTLGVEDAAQRQILYLGAGLALLLLAASVDYRLLEIVQHPFPVLVPVVLIGASAAILLRLGAGAAQGGGEPAAAWHWSEELPALGLATVLVVFVATADRAWIARFQLPAARILAAAGVLVAAASAAYLLTHFEPGRLAASHSLLLAIGLAALYAVDCLALRFSDLLRNPLYVLTLALLALTLVSGQVAGGAQSWLGAGAIQPSEPSKLLLVVVLARFLAEREQQMEKLGTVLASLVLVGLPMALIYLQPDLGTALTLLPVWLTMIWMARVRLRHLLLLAVGAAAALPAIWLGLQGYMRDRVLLFLDPASDPDSYFNVHQSLVSIGSGGWMGKGLTHGSQSQLHFLRVRHTDFVFAVTAEELGFLGALVMLALIGLVVWRMLRVIGRSQDAFGRLVVSGVVALILFQSGVNIGMNLGLVPVTGLPLPFVSYGGSSLLTFMVGAGLVQSVAMRRRSLEFD